LVNHFFDRALLLYERIDFSQKLYNIIEKDKTSWTVKPDIKNLYGNRRCVGLSCGFYQICRWAEKPMFECLKVKKKI